MNKGDMTYAPNMVEFDDIKDIEYFFERPHKHAVSAIC